MFDTFPASSIASLAPQARAIGHHILPAINNSPHIEWCLLRALLACPHAFRMFLELFAFLFATPSSRLDFTRRYINPHHPSLFFPFTVLYVRPGWSR